MMTDKQIINEIDISKCEFCDSGEYCHIYSGTADFKWMCEESEDCQIKNLLLQLKQAEQKLAEKDKEIERLKQECERLDNEAQNLFTEKTNLEIELKQLKSENEGLKEWQETVKDLFNRTCKCKYLKQEAALCGLNNKECVSINECMYRKHQALLEIKEIAEEAGNTEYLTFPNFNLKQNAKMLMSQFNGYLQQILQKISECEGNDV